MRRARGVWTVVAIVAGVVIGFAGPSAGAEPDCGKPASDTPADAPPVKADLTPVTADHVITLGRSTEGSRKWDVEFTWTATCVLRDADIKPMVRTLQGTDASLDGTVLTTTPAVDGVAHSVRVTLEVPRDPKKVPAGKFEGTLDVGNGTVGVGKAPFTIRHQEPLTVNKMSGWLQVVWIGIGLVSAVALFGAQRIRSEGISGIKSEGISGLGTTRANKGDRNSQDFTTPLAVVVGALALYPVIARLGGAKAVPWPAWPVWLGAAGLLGGLVVGVLKHRYSSKVALVGGQPFATAILVSFGAGIAVWRAEYLNSPDWALTLESALGLIGVVGGAAATSALLFLSPNPKPPEELKDTAPANGVSSPDTEAELEPKAAVVAGRQAGHA
jgi:hypothetical protein